MSLERLGDADVAYIRDHVARWRSRTKVVALPHHGRAVVKQQRPPRSAWRARSVGALSRAFDVPLLRPVPSRGGAAGQATELRRLDSLRELGVHVPDVLHVDERFFVMRHLDGPTLAELIAGGGGAGRAAWRAGVDALVDVHAKGACLSHAFARNFIATDDGVALVDFEDDPLEALSPAEAQARDWLAWLHSTAFLLEPSHADRAMLAHALAREPQAVRELVERAGRSLAAFRRLPRSRHALGREAAGLRALAHLFPLGR